MPRVTSILLGFLFSVGLGCTDQSRLTPIEDQPKAGLILTVPAGATIFEIVDLVRKADFLSGELESEPPKEGWVAPGDYVVTPGTARSETLKMLVERQEGRLGAAWDYRDTSLPLDNSVELLVLASLVECVAPGPEFYEPVASVFVNRLRRGIRLQLDATVIYGITRGEPLERPLQLGDLKRNTPWNTYVHDGLPPTPICSPSVLAIGVASHPPPTQYLYFVSDADGGLTFAETLQEHNSNVARFREATAEKSEK